jgi:hypothetical protein
MKVPATQFVQPVADEEDEYVPATQFEQIDADATEYDPAAQAPVTAVRPVVAQYDPALHSEQAVASGSAMKVPVRQLEHAVAATAEYDPVEHTAVTAVRPVVAQYDPAGQLEQLFEADDGAYDPARQLKQYVDPVLI